MSDYRYTLTFISGDTFALDVQWLDGNGDPQDMTEMLADLIWTFSVDDVILEATVDDFLTVDLDTATVHLVLLPSETGDFTSRSNGAHHLKVNGSTNETILKGALYVQ